MNWSRSRDTLFNGGLGLLVGLAIARLRGHGRPLRTGLVVGTAVAVLNWLTYEKPDVLAGE